MESDIVSIVNDLAGKRFTTPTVISYVLAPGLVAPLLAIDSANMESAWLAHPRPGDHRYVILEVSGMPESTRGELVVLGLTRRGMRWSMHWGSTSLGDIRRNSPEVAIGMEERIALIQEAHGESSKRTSCGDLNYSELSIDTENPRKKPN